MRLDQPPSLPKDRLLTLDEAYRAAFHFIAQYYEREPIKSSELMLHSMTSWSPSASLQQTSDPATWDDWLMSVSRALSSDDPLQIPESRRE